VPTLRRKPAYKIPYSTNVPKYFKESDDKLHGRGIRTIYPYFGRHVQNIDY
jgi:hypothetical protein